MIDLGAGVTDVAVWRDDAVVHSAVHGVGGDHLTQDLSIGLEVPYARAERLKKRWALSFWSPWRKTRRLP